MKQKARILGLLTTLVVGVGAGYGAGDYFQDIGGGIFLGRAIMILTFAALLFYVLRTIMGIEFAPKKIVFVLLLGTLLVNGTSLNCLDLSLLTTFLVSFVVCLHGVSKSPKLSIIQKRMVCSIYQITMVSLLTFGLLIPWMSFESCARSDYEAMPEGPFQGFLILRKLSEAGSFRAGDLPLVILIAVVLQVSLFYYLGLDKRRKKRLLWIPLIPLLWAGLWTLAGKVNLQRCVAKKRNPLVMACLQVRWPLIHSVSFPSEKPWGFVDRENPLQTAVRVGNQEIIERLFPRFDRKELPGDLLEIAGTSGQTEALVWMMEHGAVTEKPHTVLAYVACAHAPTGIQYLLAHGYPVNGYPPKSSPLHYAVACRRIENVKTLLEHGADPNGTMSGKRPGPILVAARNAAKNGDLKMVKLLLDYGADRNTLKDHYGKTARDYAQEFGFADLFE